jgi:hypothetical protein
VWGICVRIRGVYELEKKKNSPKMTAPMDLKSRVKVIAVV